MAITYTWDCKTVDVHPEENDLQNVVYNVQWKLKGVDGDYSSEKIGMCRVPLSNTEDFIPFENLTNNIVEGWVKAVMGDDDVAVLKSFISSDISEQKTPTSVTMTIGD
jgi:hypothetical protein